MKKTILAIFALSIVTLSCHKDKSPDPVIITPVQYMTLTAGSSWNYDLVNNTPPVSTTSYTLMSTANDSSINGKSYHVLTNTSGTANEYFNITGHDYYNFRQLPTVLGGTSVEYIYLKDNLGASESWDQTFPVAFSGITVSAVLKNTITAKGLTKVVKGITYTDVVQVTTTLSFTGVPLTQAQLSTDIESFYAPKYGLIQSINKIDLDYGGFVSHTNQQTELSAATIK